MKKVLLTILLLIGLAMSILTENALGCAIAGGIIVSTCIWALTK